MTPSLVVQSGFRSACLGKADGGYVNMEPWVVGIDLGATKVAVGLISPQNEVVARRRFPTDVASGPGPAVARIAQAVSELAGHLPTGVRIGGLGICSPGPLDHRAGLLIDPPNLVGWRNVPLKQMLSHELKLPVYLEHDAKAAALGEYQYGAGRGARSMVYIVVGTGVGAAIIMDGKLHRGEHNSAGEVGHITIDPAGERCSCGSIGCVETFLAGPGLARAYRRALAQSSASSSEEVITGEMVARLAGQGDPLALQVMGRAGEALGTAVASLAMILDIDLYVIGSSVAKAGDLLLEPARRAVPRHAFSSVAAHVHIVGCALQDDGPILGCGWLARQGLLGQEP
jgi:glucokinase